MPIVTVKQGDTLTKIANEYRTSVDFIIADNGILSPDNLAVGQALIIRVPEKTHTVMSGDTLASIAKMHDVTVNDLYRNNPFLEGKSDLYTGEQIVISFQDEPTASRYLNGYTYPSLDRDVLRATLPYLSYLTSFSYGFRQDGSLITPNDSEVIAITKEYPSEPILLLSTLKEDGSFSSEKADALLNSPSQQDRLFAALIEEMNQKGFVGVDVDFEYISPQNKDAFTQFILRLKKALSPYGYQVFVSLAPKTSDLQRGLQYEAHDYAALGEAADRALLMTYEWGYRYSMPMAVAPIDQVERVVRYATERIDPEKIFLGIPNYGYDWPLPYVAGMTQARSISNPEAVDLAARYGAEIFFDQTAQSPYFRYKDENGILHEVWFEDPRSILAKSDLAKRYRLSGINVWNLLRYYPGLWSMLASRANTTIPATEA